MRILVTGAAGFIGAALSQNLVRSTHEVLGLDNFTPYYDVNLKHQRIENLKALPGFQFHELDLCQKKHFFDLNKKFKPDRIVHLAAQPGVRYSMENPSGYLDSNITAFMNVLEAARHLGTQHLVYTSSSSVYGANTLLPYSENYSTEHPISLYAATKKSNEMMAHCYSHIFRIPCTGLRFFTVYGPWGRPDMATFVFTRKILNGEKIEVYNNGHQHRDFTYIADLVEGVARILQQPARPDPQWSGKSPNPATSLAAHSHR